MLLAIPNVISRDAALALGQALAVAAWTDGNATSGAGAALAKHNRQLPETGAAARSAQRQVQQALSESAPFLSAALPKRIYPPLFNRYGPGDGFGDHIDNAIRIDPATGTQLRTDLSATLFLTDPDGYDGGELIVEGQAGGIKLAAGGMILYPATSIHRVTPVTRGERIACFFWIESLVRDGTAREILFDLDQSIQILAEDRGLEDREVLRLTKTYHNLVRRWAG
jgi:PKHD-type hydroxylase